MQETIEKLFPELDERDAMLVAWYAIGLKKREVAEITRIPHSTIDYLTAKLRKKYKLAENRDFVKMAWRRELNATES